MRRAGQHAIICVTCLIAGMFAAWASADAQAPKETLKETSAVSLRNQPLRAKLEMAHRILHMEGLAEDSTRGHITARSEDGLVYIKPWGSAFEWVTATEMQGIDMDGKLIDGKGKMHSERVLHLEILKARNDAGSVIHVHPYYSILLSTVFTGSIVNVAQQSVPFTGNIPFYTDPWLIQTKEQAVEVAKTLGDSPVILMKNHGITVVGKNIEEAVVLAIHFEQSAKDHLMANQFGKPSGMSAEDCKKLYKNNYTPDQIKMVWDYMAAKAAKKYGSR